MSIFQDCICTTDEFTSNLIGPITFRTVYQRYGETGSAGGLTIDVGSARTMVPISSTALAGFYGSGNQFFNPTPDDLVFAQYRISDMDIISTHTFPSGDTTDRFGYWFNGTSLMARGESSSRGVDVTPFTDYADLYFEIDSGSDAVFGGPGGPIFNDGGTVYVAAALSGANFDEFLEDEDSIVRNVGNIPSGFAEAVVNRLDGDNVQLEIIGDFKPLEVPTNLGLKSSITSVVLIKLRILVRQLILILEIGVFLVLLDIINFLL